MDSCTDPPCSGYSSAVSQTPSQSCSRYRLRFLLLAALALGGSLISLRPAGAVTFPEPLEVQICFDYACAHQAPARFEPALLARIAAALARAQTAAEERSLIAESVAQLYVLAALQTPIWRDRGGNRNDNTDLPGAMDCLDHTANTTAFLHLMQRAGMLRFHRVGDPVRRVRFFVAEHWSARIVDSASDAAYVVDSWFFDLGTPAVVLPLAAWRAGDEPVAVRASLP